MLWGASINTKIKVLDIKEPVHISGATLEVPENTKVGDVQVWFQKESVTFMIAMLTKRSQFVPLSLILSKGEKVGMFTKGRGTVHLSGYILKYGKPDDSNALIGSVSAIQKNDDHATNVSPNKNSSGTSQGNSPENSPTNLDSLRTKALNSENFCHKNVTVEDLVAGTGGQAKWSDTVSIYYKSQLQNTEQYINIHLNGQPFQLCLGKRAIVTGLDEGILGMNVGSKRRIICPPEMAYGKTGIPSIVPPNSTIVFEVDLVSIDT